MSVVVIEKRNEDKLREIGVKDSKQLKPKEREGQKAKLVHAVEEQAFELISSEELNTLMVRHSLNEIEAMRIGKLLNGLKKKPDRVFIDCPDPVENTFLRRLDKYLSFECEIIAEHKADVNYPVVSAASIFAKVRRDEEVRKLAKELNVPLGSGYPSDELAIKFIKEYLDKNNELPKCCRDKWDTTARIVSAKYQKKLFEG